MTHEHNGTGKSQIATLPNDLILLSLKEIAENLGAKYTELYGFARQPGFAEAIGAVDAPGVKGVRYLPAAQDIFAHLLEMKRQNRVEPHTCVEWVRNAVREDTNSPIANIANGSKSEFAKMENVGITAFVPALALLERFVDVAERRAVEEREVMTAEMAAEYLCCTVRLLRRSVPASFRLGKSREGDRWYRRDLLGLKGGDER